MLYESSPNSSDSALGVEPSPCFPPSPWVLMPRPGHKHQICLDREVGAKGWLQVVNLSLYICFVVTVYNAYIFASVSPHNDAMDKAELSPVWK